MAQRVESDESHDFKKLFGPFWFFLYYLMGYPLRILGCFLDGFVIYWLVYDVRESNFQAWLAAITGAILIQVVLGLSTTVSAKNLFRGLLFRSVAYALMFLVTATFAGGSLYSTLYLSRNGSAVAVEAFSPKLKPVTTEAVRQQSDQSVNTLAAQQAQEVAQLTATNKEARAELKAQIKTVERTIKKNQRIVDGYAEGVTVPWEYRSPILTGQKELKRLNRKLLELTAKHQDHLAATRSQQSEERALARKVGLASLDEVKAVNEQKAAKLDIYGLLAVGGNVGINLLSFFIMLGYELFLKFSGDVRGDGRCPTLENGATVAQKPLGLTETFVAQVSQEKSPQFFPYERHKKNAKLSFGRAFQPSKNPKTTKNRMAVAQQHINALLWEGFDVKVSKTDKTRLVIDGLDTPTLEKGKWEGVVQQGRGGVVLEKFELG